VEIRTVAVAGHGEDDLLRLAASVEASSEHPLGRAMVAEAQKRGLQLASATNFKSTTGGGVSANVEGKNVAIGNEKVFGAEARSADVKSIADTMRAGGGTVTLVGIDGQIVAAIGIADPIKASTPEAL